jgi:SRSO17 transposase
VARTPVVELDADVLERLEEYVAEFAGGLGFITRKQWAGIYLQGLLLDGERKSIEPLSRRVSVPGWHGDTEQALQQFVNQSLWDELAVLQTYRRLMGEAFDDAQGIVVIDDTGFAKKGRHSVGVARQYSGTLGKTDNCQIAVSLHYAGPKGDYPLALRVFLPESWTSQPERMQAARVPPQHRTPRTKNEIALELLDQMHTEGLPYRAVVADAGYGIGVEFRRGLDARGVLYVVGIAGNEAVLTEQPTWSVKSELDRRRRPPKRWYLPDGAASPVAVKRLAETLERIPFSWRLGSKRPLHAEFAWVRVWPAHRWGMGRAADDVPNPAAEVRWLLVEWRSDGSIRYALSNLPETATLAEAVGIWKTRWQVEQGYQQLKEELGLDHFEGRSWPGFHHHAALCFLAYGFLALERRRRTATGGADADETETSPFADRHQVHPPDLVTVN